jgi:hypothetical protein
MQLDLNKGFRAMLNLGETVDAKVVDVEEWG